MRLGFGVFAVMAFLAVLASVSYLFHHEMAHQVIYAKYGIDSMVEYGFLYGKVTPDAEQYWASDDLETVRALQASNDTYGYQILTLIGLAFMNAFLLLIYVEYCANIVEKRLGVVDDRLKALLAEGRRRNGEEFGK